MKTIRQIEAEFRKKNNLTYRCECGGIMEYAFDFGQIFSVCRRCSEPVKIDLTKLKLRKESA